MVLVSTEDRTGHEGVPEQAIIHSVQKSSPGADTGVQDLQSLISFHSLTHQLGIYRVPNVCSVPFWRYTDDQGSASILLGELAAQILPQ